MNNNIIILLLFLISLVFFIQLNTLFAYNDPSIKDNYSSVLLPFAYLQYGPSSESAIIMYFNSVFHSQGNGTIGIYNPDLRENSVNLESSYSDNVVPLS